MCVARFLYVLGRIQKHTSEHCRQRRRTLRIDYFAQVLDFGAIGHLLLLTPLCVINENIKHQGSFISNFSCIDACSVRPEVTHS